MQTALVPTIAPVAAARWSRRAPVASPWLHEEVARRMQDRLQWITMQPRSWLDWEPLMGGLQGHALVAGRYPQAVGHVLQATPAQMQAARMALTPKWWKPARWRGERLAFGPPAEPVQMLWANMALHMASDPQALLARWHELLAVDGFLMFSCLGPDTLRSLRRLYATRGWPAPSHTFTDMHDWGDMLVQCGFAEPVMDMEHIRLTFDTPQRLLAELRELGRNLHVERFSGLRGRAWQAQLCQALQQELADPAQDGRLTLEFEIIYGHAFKPAARVPVREHSSISLGQMRSALGMGGRKAVQD